MTVIYPGATYRPLGPQIQPRMTSHDVVCFHTMVGTLAGTRQMFMANGYGGTESHFGLGGNGEMDQWQDLAFTADANLYGNPRVISLETEDKGPLFPAWSGSDVPAWTDAQVQALAAWLAWVCSPATHAECPPSWACHQVGIPLQLVNSSAVTERGVAWHRMGIDGNFPPLPSPYAGRRQRGGGQLWSNSSGKSCPGPRRIDQVPLVINLAKLGVDPGATPSPAPAPAPAPAALLNPFGRLLLDEDGGLGPKTIKEWQLQSGTTPDGFISGSRVEGGYFWNTEFSSLVAAAQRKFGTEPDGRISRGRSQLVGAMQKAYGTSLDYRISFPESQLIQELQKRLNRGTY